MDASETDTDSVDDAEAISESPLVPCPMTSPRSSAASLSNLDVGPWVLWGLLVALLSVFLGSMGKWLDSLIINNMTWGNVAASATLAGSLAFGRAVELVLARWTILSSDRFGVRFFSSWSVALTVTFAVLLSWSATILSELDPPPRQIIATTLILGIVSFPLMVLTQGLVRFLYFKASGETPKKNKIRSSNRPFLGFTLLALTASWLTVIWGVWRFQVIWDYLYYPNLDSEPSWDSPIGVISTLWIASLPLSWLANFALGEGLLPYLMTRQRLWFVLTCGLIIVVCVSISVIGLSTPKRFDPSALERMPVSLALFLGTTCFLFFVLLIWGAIPPHLLPRHDELVLDYKEPHDETKSIWTYFRPDTSVWCAGVVLVIWISAVTTGGDNRLDLALIRYQSNVTKICQLWASAPSDRKIAFLSELQRDKPNWTVAEKQKIADLMLATFQDPEESLDARSHAFAVSVELQSEDLAMLETLFEAGELGEIARRGALNVSLKNVVATKFTIDERNQLARRLASCKYWQLHLQLAFFWRPDIGFELPDDVIKICLESNDESLQFFGVSWVLDTNNVPYFADVIQIVKRAIELRRTNPTFGNASFQNNFGPIRSQDNWRNLLIYNGEMRRNLLDVLLQPDPRTLQGRDDCLMIVLLFFEEKWVTWDDLVVAEPNFLDRLVAWQAKHSASQTHEVFAWLVNLQCFEFDELAEACERFQNAAGDYRAEEYLDLIQKELDAPKFYQSSSDAKRQLLTLL